MPISEMPVAPIRPSFRATGVQSALPALQITTENCPTGKSVIRSVISLSSPACKNILLNPSGKSSLQARPVPPEKGAGLCSMAAASSRQDGWFGCRCASRQFASICSHEMPLNQNVGQNGEKNGKGKNDQES
jgi:hypothetical protein